METKAQHTDIKPLTVIKKALSALLHAGLGSLVWRKSIRVPAAILRLNPLSSPQAAIGTLQFQLYCCYQLLHAAWAMSPPQLPPPPISNTPPPSISWTSLNLSITANSTYCSLLSWAVLYVVGMVCLHRSYDALWFSRCVSFLHFSPVRPYRSHLLQLMCYKLFLGLG